MNQIKCSIVFKIKTGYKLEFLFPKTMTLLGSTKKDADKDKNSQNGPKLEYFKFVLVHYNLSKMIINTHQRFWYFCSK